MNDENEGKINKKATLSQSIANTAAKTLRSIKKMHSFNRHLKNSNKHKNPDVETEVPSYMRQTCSSLVKRHTFKRRSLSNSTKETSPSVSEKSHKTKTRNSSIFSRNSTSSPRSHSESTIVQQSSCLVC